MYFLFKRNDELKVTFKNLKIETDSNLREINGGDWENKPFDDLIKLYPKEYKVWLDDIGRARCVNGESVKELQKRVVRAVENIAKENSGKTGTVVEYVPKEPETQAPTVAPTQKPTEKPTEAPTDAPTEAPTEAPQEPEVTEPVATEAVELEAEAE